MFMLATVSIARCSVETMKATNCHTEVYFSSYNTLLFTTTRTQAISDPVITSKGLMNTKRERAENISIINMTCNLGTWYFLTEMNGMPLNDDDEV